MVSAPQGTAFPDTANSTHGRREVELVSSASLAAKRREASVGENGLKKEKERCLCEDLFEQALGPFGFTFGGESEVHRAVLAEGGSRESPYVDAGLAQRGCRLLAQAGAIGALHAERVHAE